MNSDWTADREARGYHCLTNVRKLATEQHNTVCPMLTGLHVWLTGGLLKRYVITSKPTPHMSFLGMLGRKLIKPDIWQWGSKCIAFGVRTGVVTHSTGESRCPWGPFLWCWWDRALDDCPQLTPHESHLSEFAASHTDSGLAVWQQGAAGGTSCWSQALGGLRLLLSFSGCPKWGSRSQVLWMRGSERPQTCRLPHWGPRCVSEATLDPSAMGWLWTQGTRLTPHRAERNCPYYRTTAPALPAELWANEWLLF